MNILITNRVIFCCFIQQQELYITMEELTPETLIFDPKIYRNVEIIIGNIHQTYTFKLKKKHLHIGGTVEVM